MTAQATTLPVHLGLVVGDGEPIHLVYGEIPLRVDPQEDIIAVSVDPAELSAIVQDLCKKVIGTPAAE